MHKKDLTRSDIPTKIVETYGGEVSLTKDSRLFPKAEIQKTLRSQFSILDDFLLRWNGAERKQTVIDELREHAIPLAVLP